MQTAESVDTERPTGPTDTDEMAVCRALAAEMQVVQSGQKCTKRTAVRLAISNSIQSNVLKPGDYLPSELALTKILNVSLGTVQAALQQLRDVGLIVRRRGDGTRVTSHEPWSDKVWHFRYLSKDSRMPLRIVEESLQLETVDEDGFWSDHLGGGQSCYRIVRQLGMRDGTRTGADMYIPCSMALGLADIDTSELLMINIRPFLEVHLNLKITAREHVVTTVTPDPDLKRSFELTSGGTYYEIHARTWSSDSRPVYFQRMLVATSDCDLKF